MVKNYSNFGSMESDGLSPNQIKKLKFPRRSKNTAADTSGVRLPPKRGGTGASKPVILQAPSFYLKK